ncbi:YeiH family protein [Nocardia jinanensis]|uniref:AraC family transcriptional regulator n=1 Tax=Nocardia jinanensis TaxID=382504 RepID=A0A917R5D1_9NOCA|nr:putative sulfate exporter family transporter [Nocardia jinanensis]GGK91195.1 AraC family transcriptional regulator [Nocardia jinanensis]
MRSSGITGYRVGPIFAKVTGVNEVYRRLPGLALAATLATTATALSAVAPLAGAPVLALVCGAALGGRAERSQRFGPGLDWARQHLLSIAIVLLGLGLPLDAVLTVGRETAVVLLGTLCAGAVTAVVVGRMLALHRESAVLIAAGTTICGASAIAAATAVLKPDRERVAYALGTIFVFNIAAVLVYPPLGRLLGMSDRAFGLWAGTAVNDTSSVLAAGIAFGPAAASFAVIVKLVRSLMIVPLCVGLHLSGRRGAPWTPNTSLWRTVPLFVVLFVVASALAGAGIVPADWTGRLADLSSWLVAAVLAAIGTSLTWRRLRSAGLRPLLFGGILAVALGVAALVLQYATGWR